MTTKEIVETIMYQHWDLKSCDCWVCSEGRANGIKIVKHEKKADVRVADEILFGH